MTTVPALSPTTPIGSVAELWRYPVKSLRGERIPSLAFDPTGVAGDRRFALQSSGAPVGKPLLTGRERAQLLLHTASGAGEAITITTPAGEVLFLHDPGTLPHLERAINQGHQLSLVASERPLTDCRPVALLSLQAVTQLEHEFGAPIDPRRFRANLLLNLPAPLSTSGSEPFPEDALVGQRIRIGTTAVLHVTERDPRCRIVILDPETADPDPRLMKLIDRLHNGRVGIYATVLTPGTVRTGDPIQLL